MPAEDFQVQQREGGVGDDNHSPDRHAVMTSRGTKYWSSGSIPLIGPDMLGEIIAKASDISIVISEAGTVLSVLINPEHQGFGEVSNWEGRDIRDFLTPESIPKLEAQLERFMVEADDIRAIELNHSDSDTFGFPVRYTFQAIGPDGAILMLGRDLRPIAEMQQQLVKAQIALERDYEAQREYDTRFRVLMDVTNEAFVFVSQTSGRIVEINAEAAALFGGSIEDLRGASFAQEFEGRRKSEVVSGLVSIAISEGQPPLELTTRRARRSVLAKPTAFRAAGERMLIVRLSSSEDEEAVADDLTENLSALYQEGAEAIVFTDADGLVRSANESFLNLIDAPHLTRIKGRSLGDFFVRGAVDLKVLVENAKRVGQMRIYATKLASEYGSQIAVEISATWLDDQRNPAIVFVIRDTSRAEAVRKTKAAINDEGVRSVMELVGSASLKEIVSETNDVVEKMCIETAVELTRNNRVAAAEMLGLSRQSLYVKLRKYGLLNRNDS